MIGAHLNNITSLNYLFVIVDMLVCKVYVVKFIISQIKKHIIGFFNNKIK